MLDRLDEIDWRSLEHAYGSAEDVPQRLRALLSKDKAERSAAMYELSGSVWHQGTIYSASAYVFPFLVELIEAPEVQEKPYIICLIASLAGGRGYYEVHEAILQNIAKRPLDLSAERRAEVNAVAAVRRVASSYIPALLPHLTHPEAEVRLTVAAALPLYPEHHPASKAALLESRKTEASPEVLEAFDEALTAISQTP